MFLLLFFRISRMVKDRYELNNATDLSACQREFQHLKNEFSVFSVNSVVLELMYNPICLLNSD